MSERVASRVEPIPARTRGRATVRAVGRVEGGGCWCLGTSGHDQQPSTCNSTRCGLRYRLRSGEVPAPAGSGCDLLAQRRARAVGWAVPPQRAKDARRGPRCRVARDGRPPGRRTRPVCLRRGRRPWWAVTRRDPAGAQRAARGSCTAKPPSRSREGLAPRRDVVHTGGSATLDSSMCLPKAYCEPAYDTSSTGLPSTDIRGRMPRPGVRDAAMRPFARCGAPSAIETVPYELKSVLVKR